MNSPELNQALDDATAGLADDPELRLDVRRELRTHVEDALEDAEGATDTERLRHALKALGSSIELAGVLAEGNRQRMKLRALVRMTLRWLLVPAAVAMALFIVLRDLVDIRVANAMGMLEGEMPSAAPGLLRELTEDQAFLFTGDLSRTNEAARQRSIWEREPENPVYFGNYITRLLAEGDCKDRDFARLLEQELLRGESLDPDNARYPYLLAALLFEAGSNWEGDGESSQLMITDPASMERGVEVLRAARAKPEFHRYFQEMNRVRFGMLDEPRRLIDRVERMSVVVAIVLPDLNLLLSTVRVLPPCAEQLAADGRPEEAVELLDTWKDLSVKLNDDSFGLIDNLVVGSMIKLSQKEIPPVLERMGRPEQAAEVRDAAERLGRPLEAWRARQKRSGEEEAKNSLLRHGGILARITLPALGEVVEDEKLRHGRELDFVLAERVLLIFVNILFLLLMAGSAILWARWRRVPGAASAPFLLLPPIGRCARVFAAGAVLPVLMYYIYSRWTGLGGRGYAMMFMPGRFVTEFVLLGATVLFCSSTIAAGFIRRRCGELGVPIPPRRETWHRVFGVAVGLGWVLCLAVRVHTLEWTQPLAVGAASVVGGGLAIGLCAVFLRRLFGGAEYGLFFGTLGRSLVPVYASAIILLGLLTYPYLSHAETRLIRGDQLMRVHPDAGFSSVEAQVAERIKTDFAEAADELGLR